MTMALELELTQNRAALRQALTFKPSPKRIDRSLDLLVLNQGHGGIANFEHWTAQELSQNLVQPMLASGMKANIIVLDFCLSASLVDCFSPLCAPDGIIYSNLYSTSEVLVTTDLWSKLAPSLKARDVGAMEKMLKTRAAQMASSLTGFANLEPVRAWTGGNVRAHLSKYPFDRDAISIIRYLPEIADVLKDDKGASSARCEQLTIIGENSNLSLKDRAILVGLPVSRGGDYDSVLKHIDAQFRQRVTNILVSLGETPAELTKLPTFGSGGLWERVMQNRAEILATAPGLKRCPTPITLYQKYDKSLSLDAAFTASPMDPNVMTLIRSVDPFIDEDLGPMMQLLDDSSGISLNGVKNFLQPPAPGQG